MAIGLRHDGNGKVLEFRHSVDGLEYVTRPNSVAWHDQNATSEKLAALLVLMRLPFKYLKWAANDVTEMSTEEKAAVDAAEVAAASQAVQDAMRVNGPILIDAKNTEAAVLRAIVLLLIDELNSLRVWITSFKAATAAATTLANLQSRVAALANMPDRTAEQAKTAIKAKLEAGDAD
jgi:hypothetical protein